MPRIAITGHMNLTPDSVSLIYQAIAAQLEPHASNDLVGISCIARGADSIFAQAVLDLGGALEVVLPAANYRHTKVKPDHAAQFDDFMRRASKVHTTPFAEASRDAYAAANELLLTADELFAVWDGQVAVDKGSTASVVADAKAQGLTVRVIWPTGAARE